MKKVVEEIQALHDREGGEIEYFIADASEPNHDFETIAKSYQHFNFKLRGVSISTGPVEVIFVGSLAGSAPTAV